MGDTLTAALMTVLGCELVPNCNGVPACLRHARWAGDGPCPEAEQIAAALAPAISAREREAAARALEDYAAQWDRRGETLSVKALELFGPLVSDVGRMARRHAATIRDQA